MVIGIISCIIWMVRIWNDGNYWKKELKRLKNQK